MTTGCLSDFSPDPLKSDQQLVDAGADAGRAGDAGGGGQTDTGVVAPPTDSGSTVPEDSGQPNPGGPCAPSADGLTICPSGPTSANAPAGCDVSGRYIVTEHIVTNLLGAQQVARNWYYYEVSQNGSDLTVTAALGCGSTVNGIGIFSATADDSGAWFSYAQHQSFGGRKGTATANGGGCAVHFDRDVAVKGATVPYYKDTSIPLPKLEQQQMGSTPGWEDWDEDGNAGYTLQISGVATGDLYTATRMANEFTGTIASNAPSPWHLVNDWSQDRSNLPDQSGILGFNAGRDPDDTLHYVEFGKLSQGQAGGTDRAAICAAVLELAPMLTPNANKVEANKVQ